MKTTLYLILTSFLCFSSFSCLFGQSKKNAKTRYDDSPIIIPRNADILKYKTSVNKGEVLPNFNPIGTSWSQRVISYAFQNGTNDIVANDE